jgi:biopolymer transport protein TolR
VRPGRPTAEINVTPLVDVVLVLLIVFMVATPLLDRMLRVRVPDAEQEASDEDPVPQIVVSVAPDGALLVNSERVGDGEYVPRLRRALAARAQDDRVVFFAADDAAPYQRLVVALEGGRRAGAEALTMTTDPMAERQAGSAAARRGGLR